MPVDLHVLCPALFLPFSDRHVTTPEGYAAKKLRGGISAGNWYADPVGFAENCFRWPRGESLTDYQKETMAAVVTQKRVAVRGPHGLGKTAMEAILLWWFALTREDKKVDWKVASTAGAWRQLERYLWPEVHKWGKRLIPLEIGRGPINTRTELMNINLKLAYGQAFAVASDDPALIEGVHADSVLYLFDESKSIIAGTFDAAEGAFSGSGEHSSLEAFAVAMSTPGSPNGRFYDIHVRKPGLEDWWTRHVTVEESLAAGRVSLDWVDQRRKQWGENSAVFANRVLGEFHSSDEDGVIPLAWVEKANERWLAWRDGGKKTGLGRQTVGVDVARFGDDKTVLAIRDGDVCTAIQRYDKQDTMATTGRVKGLLDHAPAREAIVDVIGIGAGVVDRLREQKNNVTAFNAAAGTKALDRSGELGFTNCRSAAWWGLRELLDPAYDATIALPPDDNLTGDLCAPKYRVLSGGKIQIEPKDDIRKRIGRSPDDGDAVVQAFWDGIDNSAEGWVTMLKGRTPEPVVIAAPPEASADARQLARHRAFQGGGYV